MNQAIDRPDKISRPDWLITGILTLLATGYYLSYLRYGLDMSDEGMLVNFAQRILRGERIYQDFWSHYAPLPFYLLAGLFQFFGPNLLVERLMLIGLRLLAVPGFYLLGRQILNRVGAVQASLLFILIPGHRHKVLFVLFPILGLNLFYWRRRRQFSTFWLGLLVVLAFFFRYDSGLFLAMSCALGLYLDSPLKNRPERASWSFWPKSRHWGQAICPYLAGILGGGGLALAWFGPAVLLQQLTLIFSVATGNAQTLGITYPGWSDLFKRPLGWPNFETSLFYLFPAIYLLTGVQLLKVWLKRKSPRDFLPMLLIWFMAVTMFNQGFWQANLAHLLQAVPLGYILAIFLAEQGRALFTAQRGRRWHFLLPWLLRLPGLGLYLLYIVYFVFIADYPASGTIQLRFSMNEKIQSARAPFFFLPKRAEEINAVLAFIRQTSAASERLLIYPSDALLSFLAERINPTPYEFYLPGLFASFPGASAQQFLLSMKRQPPRYFLYYEPNTFLGRYRSENYRFSQDAPGLLAKLLEPYHLATIIGNYCIFEYAGRADPALASFLAGYEAWQYHDFVAANASLEAAVKLGLDSPDIYRLLAEVAISQKRPERARLWLRQALARGGDSECALMLALLYFQADCWDESEALFGRALERLPWEQADIMAVRRAIGLTQLGRPSAAIAILEELCGRYPERVDIPLVLGQAYFADQRWEKALEQFLRLAPLGRGNDVALKIAQSYFQLQSWDKACSAYQYYLTLRPDDAEAILKYASCLARQGQRPAALQVLTRLIAQAPKLEAAYLQAGILARRLQQYEESRAYLEALVSQLPQSAEGYFQLGLTWQALGRWPEAQAAWQQVRRLAPDHSRAWLKLAQLARQQGDIATSLALLRELVTAYPRDISARLEFGRLWQQQGDLAQSRVQLEVARQLAPENFRVLFSLANLARQQERYQEARQYLGQILAKNGDHQAARRLLQAINKAEERRDREGIRRKFEKVH